MRDTLCPPQDAVPKTPVKVNEARRQRMEQAAAAMKRKLQFEEPLAPHLAKRLTRSGARALISDTPDGTLIIDDSGESTILYAPDGPHPAGAPDCSHLAGASGGHLKEPDAQQKSRDDFQ